MSKEKEFEKEMDMQQPYAEMNDDQLERDMSRQGGMLPSNVMPEDFYQYKRFVNLPESQEEFPRKIDKDVVFANLSGSKPDFQELRFEVGTIELFESEFVEEIRIPRRTDNGVLVRDTNGNPVIDVHLRFDEAFRGCLDFLKNQYKFSVVASRAMGGQDRAGFLDISSSTRISKELSKKQQEKKALFGSGGN